MSNEEAMHSYKIVICWRLLARRPADSIVDLFSISNITHVTCHAPMHSVQGRDHDRFVQCHNRPHVYLRNRWSREC